MTQLPNGPLVGGQCKPIRQSCTIYYSRGCTPHSRCKILMHRTVQWYYFNQIYFDTLLDSVVNYLGEPLYFTNLHISERQSCSGDDSHPYWTIIFKSFRPYFLCIEAPFNWGQQWFPYGPHPWMPCSQGGVNDFLLGFREGINYMFNTYSTWCLNQPIWKIYNQNGNLPLK